MTGFINSLFKRKQKGDRRADRSSTTDVKRGSVEEAPQSSVTVAEPESPDATEQDLAEETEQELAASVEQQPAKTSEQEVSSDETETDPVRDTKPTKNDGTFFLDVDEAKTLGDIDYMRAVKQVRKTFPVVGDNTEGVELVEQVSSIEKANSQGRKIAAVSEPTVQPSQESTERRRQDSSMDMFRNMARNIKKKS